MSTTHDELAGVVDLFGALTRPELMTALGELAFKQGRDIDETALKAKIDSAVAAYTLVEYDPVDATAADESKTLVTVGPTAFPSLPPNAEDLPHILDFDRRSVDRERLAGQVTERLTAEATAVADAGETERAAELVDVSYDIEVWAAVKAAAVRSTLESVLPQD